jgi:hypothetical protein
MNSQIGPRYGFGKAKGAPSPGFALKDANLKRA